MNKGMLPDHIDGQDNIVEKTITWKPIVAHQDSDLLSLEEDNSEDDTLEQVHFSHAGDVDVWVLLKVSSV